MKRTRWSSAVAALTVLLAFGCQQPNTNSTSIGEHRSIATPVYMSLEFSKPAQLGDDVSMFNMTKDTFVTQNRTMTNKGFSLVDFSVFGQYFNLRYSAVWKSDRNLSTQPHWLQTDIHEGEEFAAQWDAQHANGWRVNRVSSYIGYMGTRYFTIDWVKQPNVTEYFAWQNWDALDANVAALVPTNLRLHTLAIAYDSHYVEPKSLVVLTIWRARGVPGNYSDWYFFGETPQSVAKTISDRAAQGYYPRKILPHTYYDGSQRLAVIFSTADVVQSLTGAGVTRFVQSTNMADINKTGNNVLSIGTY